MLKTTAMLVEEYGQYKNPMMKIGRLVKNGQLFPVIRGLYETNKNVSLCSIANAVYGPSYVSFESALSYYGMIPERVAACTSATCNKHKSKEYRTSLGTFIYADIPAKAFPYGITIITLEDGYPFAIATLEKCICDKLYSVPPVRNMSEMEYLLFQNLRFDEDVFGTINIPTIDLYASLYHCTNVSILNKLICKKGVCNEWNYQPNR